MSTDSLSKQLLRSQQTMASRLTPSDIKFLIMVLCSLAAVISMGVVFSPPVEKQREMLKGGITNVAEADDLQQQRVADLQIQVMEEQAVEQQLREEQRLDIQQQPSKREIFDPLTVPVRRYNEIDIMDDGTAFLFLNARTNGPKDSCTDLVENKDRITRIHYHAAMCSVFDKMFGNRLGHIYGMKMMAYAMKVPFEFTCYQDESSQPNGAYYLMQMNDLPMGPPPMRDGVEMTPEDVCTQCDGVFCSWYSNDLDVAAPYMIDDWKWMSRYDVANILDHDDVVIHLRLGDGLKSTYGLNEAKGVFPHATYINLIEQTRQERGHIFSIGIVTAPFKGANLRNWDSGYTSLSETITMDLVKHLSEAFPEAEVRLHNSPESSVMESLARIVHARKAAICGCTTFCPYPLLATKGLGFIYNPVGGQNQWVRNAAKHNEHIRLFETPMLNGLMISNEKTGYKMPENRVMRWLREQDPNVGNIDITEAPIFRYKE